MQLGSFMIGAFAPFMVALSRSQGRSGCYTDIAEVQQDWHYQHRLRALLPCMQATLQSDGAGKELDNLKLLESMGLEVCIAACSTIELLDTPALPCQI